MGAADATIRTTEVLTRLAIAGQRLGIDLGALQTYIPRLGSAPGQYARIWVDADGERLAIRCRARDGATGFAAVERPGEVFYELESAPAAPRVGERVLVVGTRSLAEDLAVLATASIDAGAREELAARMVTLGGGRSDALARRTEADQTKWTASLRFGGSLPEVMQTIGPLLAIAEAIAVPPFQRRLLEQAHLALAAPRGFTIAIACDRTSALPQLTVEYAAVPWKQAVGLTDALRPGSPCGPRLGTFAGAFDAPGADALEVTFRSGAPAWVRIAVEHAHPVG